MRNMLIDILKINVNKYLKSFIELVVDSQYPIIFYNSELGENRSVLQSNIIV